MIPTTALRARLTRHATAAATISPRPRRPRRKMIVSAALALGLLAPFAVAPASASARGVLPPRTALERHIGWVVEKVINLERALHGVRAVHMSPQLLVSARSHNVDMARHNSMSHQLPGEAFFATRMSSAGYHWSWAGENIAWNASMTTAGVIQLEQLMYAERAPNNGHRLNILNRHFRDVGIDVYMDRAHHKVWLTTDFGHR
jgi:uncharacterized protein YkwD